MPHHGHRKERIRRFLLVIVMSVGSLVLFGTVHDRESRAQTLARIDDRLLPAALTAGISELDARSTERPGTPLAVRQKA